MDYIDATTTGTLSPHILPSTLHLPFSSEDTLHSYEYLPVHVLITNKQFLQLINIPIQDQSQHFPSTKFSLWVDIPHGNITAHYDVNTLYLRITQDENHGSGNFTSQFRFCQEVNGQFCNIPTPFQPLVNPPSCITALYAKKTASISHRCSLQVRKSSDVSMPSQLAPNVWILTTAPSAVTTTITLICPGETMIFIKVKKPVHVLQLPTACCATSPHFHLPPRYETTYSEVNISLDMANLHMINISSLDLCIQQHLEKHQNESQLQHLASIPSVPIGQLYSHMAKGIQHITPFSPEESTGDTDSIWTLFSHIGV